jgi:hypothetical protein
MVLDGAATYVAQHFDVVGSSLFWEIEKGSDVWKGYIGLWKLWPEGLFWIIFSVYRYGSNNEPGGFGGG